MADEEHVAHAGLGEDRRQDVVRLVVHIAKRAREDDGIGPAVPAAAVDERAEPGGRRDAIRKIAPRGDAPEPLVEEDERRRLVGRGADPPRLEPLAGEAQIEAAIGRTRGHPAPRTLGCSFHAGIVAMYASVFFSAAGRASDGS